MRCDPNFVYLIITFSTRVSVFEFQNQVCGICRRLEVNFLKLHESSVFLRCFGIITTAFYKKTWKSSLSLRFKQDKS